MHVIYIHDESAETSFVAGTVTDTIIGPWIEQCSVFKLKGLSYI